MGANKKEFIDYTASEENTWYYYKVLTYYKDISCLSAPIKARYGNEYYVKVFYSVTDVNDVLANKVAVYPNPTHDDFTVEAEGLLLIRAEGLPLPEPCLPRLSRTS